MPQQPLDYGTMLEIGIEIILDSPETNLFRINDVRCVETPICIIYTQYYC